MFDPLKFFMLYYYITVLLDSHPRMITKASHSCALEKGLFSTSCCSAEQTRLPGANFQMSHFLNMYY